MRSLADLINNDILAARGAALIDILLIVGIVFAILLSDRVGRIRLQILGFVGCAAGLFLASLSAFYTGGRGLAGRFLDVAAKLMAHGRQILRCTHAVASNGLVF